MLAIATAAPLSSLAADVGPASEAMLPPPMARSSEQTLYLDVSLNRTPRGLAIFNERDGRLRATADTLRTLGFRLDDRLPQDWVDLDSLPGVSVRYDASLQKLALDAPLDLLQLTTTVIAAGDEAPPPATASPGMLLNYDLYGGLDRDNRTLALTSELRVFGIGRGNLSSTQLMRYYQNRGEGGWRSESVRLDSAWQLDFPDAAVSLTVGDFYSGFVDWSRPVRMGGIQIGRNYGLQPYRVLTPTPAFLGEATVPSNVELYVDGLRQYSGEVPVGPFQLATQPGVSGNGNAQVVITDAYGQVRTLDFSFYGTQQLLAKGLSDGSLGVGRIRRDYGIRSFAYDDHTIGSATLRYGVSDAFTAEAHAEAGGGLRNAGLGAQWLLGNAGVFSAAYSHSRMADLQGGQYALGYRWNNRQFNIGLNTQRSHGDYRDLGALQGSLPARVTDQATAGINAGLLGSFNASYVRLSSASIDNSRYAGLYWSRNFGAQWSSSLSLNQNLDDSDDRSVYLSVSAALGGQRQASLGLQRNGDTHAATADLSRPTPGDGEAGGFGWRLQARQSEAASGGLAEIGWLNRAGRYSAGLAQQGGGTFGYANASGSLVWMGGSAFAARDVPDAFALVSTGGFPGIPVRLENRLIGVTDRNGQLLVTPLQSWQRNRLSIDTLHLPADLRADRVDVQVTPRQQAGVQVEFGLRQVRAAVLVLHDADGKPLPLGSRVRLAGQPPALVGYDGEVWLEGLQAHNRIEVETEDRRCQLRVDYPDNAGPQPRLGPLRCLPATTP